MSNYSWHLSGIIRRYWLSVGKTFLLLSIGTTLVGLFSPLVPSDLPSLLYIISFAIYVSSEKIEGRVIPAQEKAFCYFGSYALLFYFVVHRIWRMPTSRATVAWVVLVLFIMTAVLVAYQIRYFRLGTNKGPSSRWVLILGILAVSWMSLVPVMYLRKGLYLWMR